MKYNLKKISGDASFREFYRLKKNNKTSIIVSAKKEKFKNLAVYAVINNVLNNNRINAPKLLSNHYKNDMIEISDLGKESFYDHVISKKTIPQLEKLTNKKITYIPFWVNQNKWFEIKDKKSLRSKYKFSEYVVKDS